MVTEERAWLLPGLVQTSTLAKVKVCIINVQDRAGCVKAAGKAQGGGPGLMQLLNDKCKVLSKGI